MGPQKINNGVSVDAGLNLLGKEIKKLISSIAGSVRNNSKRQWNERYYKSNQTIEEFYLKELVQTLLVKKEDF